MENEKRLDLIDRKDLIKAVEAKQFALADNTHPYEAIRIQGKYFREVVDNAPTVDAVEVVRCRDCKDHNFCEIEDLLTLLLGIKNPYCAAGKNKCNFYGERMREDAE